MAIQLRPTTNWPKPNAQPISSRAERSRGEQLASGEGDGISGHQPTGSKARRRRPAEGEATCIIAERADASSAAGSAHELPPIPSRLPGRRPRRARFYGDCSAARRAKPTWIDFDSRPPDRRHLAPSGAPGTNPVDGEDVPVPHFGLVLRWRWSAGERLRRGRFVIAPTVRSRAAGEQATMFLLDPAGNALEFKAMADPASCSRRPRRSVWLPAREPDAQDRADRHRRFQPPAVGWRRFARPRIGQQEGQPAERVDLVVLGDQPRVDRLAQVRRARAARRLPTGRRRA